MASQTEIQSKSKGKRQKAKVKGHSFQAPRTMSNGSFRPYFRNTFGDNLKSMLSSL